MRIIGLYGAFFARRERSPIAIITNNYPQDACCARTFASRQVLVRRVPRTVDLKISAARADVMREDNARYRDIVVDSFSRIARSTERIIIRHRASSFFLLVARVYTALRVYERFLRLARVVAFRIAFRTTESATDRSLNQISGIYLFKERDTIF